MTGLVYTVLAIPFFIFFAWFARRLLGVRRLSAVKTVVAALVGLALGDLVGIILHRRGLETDVAVVVALVLGLIFTMVVILGFEAVAGRDRRRRRRAGFPRPVRALRRWIDQARPSVEITRIASRHHLGKGFGLANAPSPDDAAAYGADIGDALEEAGGVFVKLGQLLATRTDLIPAETAAELSKLHQDVPRAPAPRSNRHWRMLSERRSDRCSPSSTGRRSVPHRSGRCTGPAWPKVNESSSRSADPPSTRSSNGI